MLLPIISEVIVADALLILHRVLILRGNICVQVVRELGGVDELVGIDQIHPVHLLHIVAVSRIVAIQSSWSVGIVH